MNLWRRRRQDGFTMPHRRAVHSMAQDVWWGATPEGNDAEAYGVYVVRATPMAGQPCWRAVRVHHLTPTENNGNHHLLFDVLDEQGKRLNDARLRITWDGGEEIVALDKPATEPGGNFPMWKGQVCAVTCIGLPSDRVEGLSTAHPDEAPGNTWFHHSFLIVFRRTQSNAPAAQSRIVGHLANGAGFVVRLLLDEGEVARQTVGDDGAFIFGDLTAGMYRVAIAGTAIVSAPILLDGTNRAEIALTWDTGAPPHRARRHFVLFAGEADFLLALDYVLALKPAFGFRLPDGDLPERLTLVGNEIPAEMPARLREAGCEVEHIYGDADTVTRALADRITRYTTP